MLHKSSIPELDLHGFPLEAALTEVERELNRAFVHDGPRDLKIITGRGSVLAPGVREHLTNHPLIKEFTLNGPTITVVLEDSE